MQHRFFALISRMRYIGRWGLMRNTFEENIQEHSHMVAVLAHGLAVIQRDILGQPADPDRCASAALFHDASEILTGDLPTPIKYYNPEIKSAYKQIEAVSCEKLLALLPPELQAGYRPLLFESDPGTAKIVKAALGLHQMRRGAEGRQLGIRGSRPPDAPGAVRHAAAVPRLLHGPLPRQLPAHAGRAGVGFDGSVKFRAKKRRNSHRTHSCFFFGPPV